MNLRAIRIGAWVAVAIAGAAMLSYVLLSSSQNEPVVASATIGGPFTLENQHGETVTEANLLGKPSAIFFGYTFCPDVCPTTLFEASVWLQELGPDADKLKVYFVTVDPARDTREVLGEYLQAFDERIDALTGSQSAVNEIVKAYRVFARKVESDDSATYTMDHTSSVFLLDAKAELVGTIAYQEVQETALAKLRRLIGAT